MPKTFTATNAADLFTFNAWDGSARIEGFQLGADRLAAVTAYGYEPWVKEAVQDGIAGTEYRYGWNQDVVFLPGITGVTVEDLEHPAGTAAGGGADGVADTFAYKAWDGADTIADFELGLDRITVETAYGYEPWVRDATRDGVAGTELVYGWNDDVVWLPGVTGVSDPAALLAPGTGSSGNGAADAGGDAGWDTSGGAGTVNPGTGGVAAVGAGDAGAETSGVLSAGTLAAAAPGHTVVLADDFSNGYDYSNWGNPFHGGVYWNGAWSWNSGDVNVRDGEMQVTMTRHADGWWTGGGFNSFKAGKTITYGTVEFDARVEEAQGTMTAILMWPASDRWPQDGEIDILETPAQDVMHTLHWGGGAGGGEDWYDSVRNQAYDETRWNHYKMTWLPGDLSIEVNGKVVAHWTGAEVPTGPMGFGAMGNVASASDGWMGGPPDGSTPGVVTVHIDNVVMSQWDGFGG